jgi:hypothetical protein
MTGIAVAPVGAWWSWTALALGEAGGYRPFWNPLPVWDYWYVLLLPLCLGISIVYKSIKCHTMRQVPREAAEIFATIIFFMVLAAAALMGLLRVVQR